MNKNENVTTVIKNLYHLAFEMPETCGHSGEMVITLFTLWVSTVSFVGFVCMCHFTIQSGNESVVFFTDWSENSILRPVESIVLPWTCVASVVVVVVDWVNVIKRWILLLLVLASDSTEGAVWMMLVFVCVFMRPSSLGGAAYCVALCLSVCPSVRLSVRPSRSRK